MDTGRGPAPATPDARVLIACFTAGVLAVHALPQLPPVSGLAGLVLPALFPWRYRAHAAMLVLGVLLTCWRAQALLDERWPESRHNEELWLQGHIASLPELRQERAEQAKANTWRFLFETQEAGLPQRIRVSWYRTDEAVQGGECWRMQLRLKTPRGSLNPGGFDYEGWLFQQGIGAVATVRAAQRCEEAGGSAVLRWRQLIVHQLGEWLPQHPALGLLAALTVGDTSGLSDADWERFRVTGTSHLIAISGFNIAIVAGVAFFMFRWLWVLWPRLCLWLPAQKAGMLGAAAIAFVYTLLAGFEPPVVRALLMLLFVLAAAWMNRLTQPSRVLALAWFVILLLDPFAVMSPGLWLSFGAVAAIFYVSTHRLRPPGFWHSFVLLQLMLCVMLAPLTLYFFHGASWCAPLVNLIAVPLFILLTPAVLAAVIFAWAWPALGIALLGAVAEVLVKFRMTLDWAVQLPDLWIPASPLAAALLLALLGAVLLFAPRGLPLQAAALLCFVPLLLAPGSAPKSGFELAALDVGQGLAVVVRTAHHALLYDTGPAFEDGFDAGESIVAPYLLNRNVRALDVMMISHSDNDHRGGAPAVRKLLRVDRELGAPPTPEPCHEGQGWDWDGVRFEVLHPNAGPWSENNGGCVLRVQAGSHAALLPADIEKGAERRLLRDQQEKLNADVLLAPHHGSKTSSTEEFIAAIHPQIVIYSAGWRHHFHHPHPSVTARYERAGVREYSTALGGALTLRVTAETGVSEVEEYRRRAAKFWNMPAEPFAAAARPAD